jgi:hypothetical protein
MACVPDVLTDQNFRFNFMFDFPLSKLYTNALISTSVDLLQSITFELSLILHNLKLQQAERAAVARARLAARGAERAIRAVESGAVELLGAGTDELHARTAGTDGESGSAHPFTVIFTIPSLHSFALLPILHRTRTHHSPTALAGPAVLQFGAESASAPVLAGVKVRREVAGLKKLSVFPRGAHAHAHTHTHARDTVDTLVLVHVCMLCRVPE